jgi:carboxymethylenebutenolidase
MHDTTPPGSPALAPLLVDPEAHAFEGPRGPEIDSTVSDRARVGQPRVAIQREFLATPQGFLPLTVAGGGGRGAALVIVPSAFGVGADLEAQMAELSGDASVVVAFDPFARTDAGPAPYDAIERVMARLNRLDRTQCAEDLHGVTSWAGARAPGGAVVLLGICFGGPFALEAASTFPASGVVTWHGTYLEGILGRAADIRCPVRLHFGGVDPFVPLDVVQAARSAFGAHPDARIIVHDGATHGYSHRNAPSYDAPAERAGMGAVRELVCGSR